MAITGKTLWILIITAIIFIIISGALAYSCPENQRKNCTYASIAFGVLASIIIVVIVYNKCHT
jgi:hypothetical protein